jgi:hypothetical protein
VIAVSIIALSMYSSEKCDIDRRFEVFQEPIVPMGVGPLRDHHDADGRASTEVRPVDHALLMSLDVIFTNSTR